MNLLDQLERLVEEDAKQFVKIDDGKKSSHGMAYQLLESVGNTVDLKSANQFGPTTKVKGINFNDFTDVLEIEV